MSLSDNDNPMRVGRPSDTRQQHRDNRLLEILADGNPHSSDELIAAGLDHWTIQRNKLRSLVENVHHGVYRAVDAPADKQHEMAAASLASPRGVICLTTAAWLHGLTVEQPGFWVALPKDAKTPATFRKDEIRRWRNPDAFHVGIDTMRMAGVDVPITNPARTAFDLWRWYRSRRNDGPDCFYEVFNNLSADDDRISEIATIANQFGKLDKTLDSLIASTLQRATCVSHERTENAGLDTDDILAELDAEDDTPAIEDIPDPDPDNDPEPEGYAP